MAEGAGLAEFDDQQATGEVFDPDGRVVWRQSHLQSVQSAERERTQEAALRTLQLLGGVDEMRWGFAFSRAIPVRPSGISARRTPALELRRGGARLAGTDPAARRNGSGCCGLNITGESRIVPRRLMVNLSLSPVAPCSARAC